MQLGPVTSIHETINAGWEKWLLFMSDIHYDSSQCDRGLLQEHLGEGLRRNADIYFVGDTIDGMQGRYDSRRSYDEIRPEYVGENYYDLITRDSVQFFAPYAKNIRVIADGNHELAIRKNANTDVLERIIYALNSGNNFPIQHGGYGGWINYHFSASMGGERLTRRIKFFHGSGGEAPVTRGAIQTARQAVYLPDADIVINGHSHNAYWIPIERERCSDKDRLYLHTQHHIRTPGYKQAYGNGAAGWEVTRGGVPKPLGCFFVRLAMRKPGDRMVCNIQVEPLIQSGKIPTNATGPSYEGIEYGEDDQME